MNERGIASEYFQAEAEKSKELARRNEEDRIRNLDLQLADWAKYTYTLFQQESTKNELSGLLRNVSDGTLHAIKESFPREVLVECTAEYILAKFFLYFGALNNIFESQNENPGICNSHNEELFFQCVAEVMGLKYEKVERILMRPRPKFFRQDSNALQDIEINDAVRGSLPSKFFENPTLFIESLKDIERNSDYFAQDVSHLMYWPYDFTRVKVYKRFVFKRVDLLKVNYGTEEVALARNMAVLIEQMGDPRVRVQKFIGCIYDQGNIYLISERVTGESIQAHINQYSTESSFLYSDAISILDRIRDYIKSQGFDLERLDIENRNVIVELKRDHHFIHRDSVKRLTLIDFEPDVKDLSRLKI